MTAVNVAFDGSRSDAADTGSGTTWVDLAGGKTADEPDFIYQGSQSMSEKIGTSEGGLGHIPATGIDMSTTPKVCLFKVLATNSSILNAKGSTGGIIEIGSGGRRSAYDRYYVVGNDTYPLIGGWLIIPIDPNGNNYSARPGTAPTLTALNWFAWVCTFSGTSKSENVVMDAFDYLAYGDGLTLDYGNGADADGVFQDFADKDEDAAKANRWGVVSSKEGILYVTGHLNIGSANPTEFTDTGAVIVWPDAEFLNSTGFFGLGIDLQATGTVISITACIFISRGTVGGTVDTRAIFTVTGTTGTLSLVSCSFQNMYSFVLTSACSLDGCRIETRDLTQASADIENCVITTVSASGVAACDDPTFGTTTDLHDCEFVQGGAGHALELTAAGNYTLTNLDWSGYGADTTNSAAIYCSASSGTYNLTISGGTTPTYRSGGATINIISNVVTISVTVKDHNGDLLSGALVLLEASDASGDLPYRESVTSITYSGTTASVTHTGHGMVDGDIVVIRGANEDPYNGVFTITNVGVNTYDYTMLSTPSGSATGTITATGGVLYGATSALGIVSDTRSFTVDQNVRGYIRKSSSSPYYVDIRLSDTVDKDTGLAVSRQMVLDE